MFRTLNKDNTKVQVTIEGARAQNSNEDIASIIFRNLDNDTRERYQMAEIAVRDAYGNDSMNGYGNLMFRTRGSNERMIITHDGKVGVGKMPEFAFDVQGDVRFTGGLYNSSGPVILGGVQTIDVTYASNVLYVSGCNVGLGTTAPEANLDVKGTFKATTGILDWIEAQFIQSGTLSTSNFTSPSSSLYQIDSHLIYASNVAMEQGTTHVFTACNVYTEWVDAHVLVSASNYLDILVANNMTASNINANVLVANSISTLSTISSNITSLSNTLHQVDAYTITAASNFLDFTNANTIVASNFTSLSNTLHQVDAYSITAASNFLDFINADMIMASNITSLSNTLHKVDALSIVSTSVVVEEHFVPKEIDLVYDTITVRGTSNVYSRVTSFERLNNASLKHVTVTACSAKPYGVRVYNMGVNAFIGSGTFSNIHESTYVIPLTDCNASKYQTLEVQSIGADPVMFHRIRMCHNI